jgi:Leucine-rich repeat (LRR) protein
MSEPAVALLLSALVPACIGAGVSDMTALGVGSGEGVPSDGCTKGGWVGRNDSSESNRHGPTGEGGAQGGGGCPCLQTLDLSGNSPQSTDTFQALALLLSPPAQPERLGWGGRGLLHLRLRHCGLGDAALALLSLSLESTCAAAGEVSRSRNGSKLPLPLVELDLSFNRIARSPARVEGGLAAWDVKGPGV